MGVAKLHAMEAAAHSDAKSSHTEEIARLAKEREDLEKQHEAHKAELLASHKPLDAHERELEEAYLRHQKELADAISQHEKEKEELLEQELTVERAKHIEDMDRLQLQMKEAQEKAANEMSAARSRHSSEIDAMQEELDKARVEIQGLADQNASLQADHDEVAKLHAMEAAAHSDAKSSHTEEIARLAKDREDLEKQHEAHKAELLASHKPLDAHERELEEAYLRHQKELADA